MQKTAIEWTTFTANPIKYRRKSDGKVVWACVKTSSGCSHCYAEAVALRFARGKLFNAANMEELEPFLDETEIAKMRGAKTIGGISVSGSRCFIGDMTDIFGEWVPDDMLNRLFSSVLELRTDVTWQLLTKRADRLQHYLSWRWGEGRIPSRNIHVGVSVENQQMADDRIPLLLRTPVAVRFLSMEPLLEHVDLEATALHDGCDHLGADCTARHKIQWIIVGAESGPQARPCDLAWIHSIIEQCSAAKIPCFVKQLGRRPYVDHSPEPAASIARKHGVGPLVAKFLQLRDPKGGSMEEWPEELRVRQWPAIKGQP